jgi:hypothetical protein
MEKKLVIVGITLVLITIGLTGCSENGDDGSVDSNANIIGDTDKIEIYDYKESTLGPYITEKRIHAWSEEGIFYNDTSEDYIVEAYARNICEETLDRVEVKCHWYDISNNLLYTDTDSESNKEPGSSFRLYYHLYDYHDFFPDVHHVVLEIIVT